MGMSDRELIERAQLGDSEWLAELFRRYGRRMYGCAHRMVTVGEVEDTFQGDPPCASCEACPPSRQRPGGQTAPRSR